MNRLFRFLFAALIWLTANPAIAQNPMLEIRRPKIINAIEVIADGVNIRKSPSSNAPKLLWWCEGESDVACMFGVHQTNIVELALQQQTKGLSLLLLARHQNGMKS